MADKRNENRKKKRLRITFSDCTEDMFNGFSSDLSPSGIPVNIKMIVGGINIWLA